MSQPAPRRCPACGRAYGHQGVTCTPGVPAVRTEDSQGIAAYCGQRGRLEVPPAMPDDIRRAVKDMRAAGASWPVVRRWLQRFGLTLDPESAPPPPRPTARGTWPPPPPRQTPAGPRPPRRETARPFTYGGGDETSQSPRNVEKCPESTGKHGPTDAAGRCPWCGRKVERALPPPRVVDRTRLGEEYRRHYDPDHGTDPRDT